MRDAIADKLLARVLGWDTARISEERPILQALSAYKYDDYQQFSPGMRFVESLAKWLQLFPEEHRNAAYCFIRDRLIFCSAAEIRHWIEMAYSDVVRPALLRRTATDMKLSPLHAPRIVESKEFRLVQRQTLFLGLSDGSRIDVFRRSHPDLSHEQICQTHELAPERVDDLLGNLRKEIEAIQGSLIGQEPVQFRTVVLLDDFSASGHSYCRKKEDGTLAGKIAKFNKNLTDKEHPIHHLVDLAKTDVILLLYAATEQALEHLHSHSEELWKSEIRSHEIHAVQIIPRDRCLRADSDNPIAHLIESVYDPAVFDSHLETGQTTDAKYGYAGCGLPLVLHHNTPNNSICLLWSYEDTAVRGLFPRVKRHKELP